MPDYENRTRRSLDAAVRELLKQKPLDQIRVRELMELCGLRRQSFYYHFKDVYELFEWSVGRERALLLDRQAECLTWQQAMRALLDRAAEERAFYRAVLERGGQAGLGEMIPLAEALETVRTYYRKRDGGGPADRETEALERRREQAILLSVLESWIRGSLPLSAEELVAALEQQVERNMAGAIWRTLQERGEWTWTP